MPDAPAPDDALFGTRWIHAFEEDTPDGEVYRPETADVPLARRPRRRLSFAADGSASVSVPGPADRPLEMAATWRREDAGLVLRAQGLGQRGELVFGLIFASPDLLLLRKPSKE